MHVLTVIAEDLSPAHLLAAIKHWVSKFEQEISNKDDGPETQGSYLFEHEGKSIAVHWNPVDSLNHVHHVDLGDSEAAGYGPDSIVHDLGENPDAPKTAAVAAPTPADPTEAAEHAAADPESTGADVHAAIAPDAA